MCGFAGFVAFGTARPNEANRRETLIAMGDRLERRGPDDAQYFDDGVLGLVYRRLSIVDVEGGRQPFVNERGDQMLVANGEIYNHAELRADLLPAHSFGSRSDCEPLLHGFEEWGIDVLQRARGMFALAHWDSSRRVLTLARDRLGIKPLYICRLRHGLLFGSELKALLAHPECPRELSWPDVDRQPISQPHSTTYVRGIDMLAGGQYLCVDGTGRYETKCYWSVEDHFGRAPFGNQASAYVDAYGELLREAVLQHLQRDVAAGLHLSGGVDSSLLAALVSEREPQMPCFTVVERISHLEGDVAAARRVTQQLGMPWFPVRFDYRSIVADVGLNLRRLEEAVWMMDSPRIELDWLFKEELHRSARRLVPGMKVVLLGQGADEFAGGYSRRVDAMRSGWSDYLQGEVESNLVFDASLAGDMSVNLWHLGRDGRASSESRYHRFMGLMTRQLQHHNLWHEDRTSSWQSLEARVPFLDHRIVELLAAVPESLHAELFWDKKIIRRALDRFLPRHGVAQPKLGFLDGRDTASIDVMQHRMLSAVAADFRDKYLCDDAGPFDARKVGALIDKALSRGPQRGVAVREALQCMAIAIFSRQLREPLALSDVEDRPVLRLMTEQDWQDWSTDMQMPPACDRQWIPTDRIVLVEDVDVVTPVKGPAGRLRFYRAGQFAGEIGHGTNHWIVTFVRNLGTPAAEDFTLQDWLDEFELPLSAVVPLLDILLHQGVIGLRPDVPPVGLGDRDTREKAIGPAMGAAIPQ